MKDTLHLHTQIVGIFGHPIKHSLSPYIHNIAFQLKKLDYVYLPFDIPSSNLQNAIKAITALNIKGVNVTIPHKEAVISYINSFSEEVGVIGSVNTIVNEQSKLIGYNTDVNGILASLLPYKNEIYDKQAAVIGAGGSARAVIYTLIRNFKPKKIFIINRNLRRAEILKDYFIDKTKFAAIKTKELIPPSAFEVIKDSKLIVHATPVGMHPNVSNSITVSSEIFSKEQIVFDLIYNPVNTLLLQTASKGGARTINGLSMLIHQASKSFELWTGIEFPIEDIQKSLQLYLNN